MNPRIYQSTSPIPQAAVCETDLRLAGRIAGKVRDVYPLPAGTIAEPSLLLIATDRLSAFDVVLPTPIPGKGAILTEIAAFWLTAIEQAGLCKTHLRTVNPDVIPDAAFEGSQTTRSDLAGRCMIGRRCQVIPVECIVRGYLEGSGWKDYQQTGSVCGISLPAGLQQCDRLPEPIFSPATKAERGEHDENISFDQACALVGSDLMTKLRDLSIAIYSMASQHAEARGLIIADTKFEFGLPVHEDGSISSHEPILIDEALTPDSSRFWPADGYAPGGPQPSFDKQFVREYLEALVQAGQWDKTDPGPVLPDRVIAGTLAKYTEARDLLLG